MATKGSNLIWLCLFFFFFNSHISHSDTDTLLQGQELRDGEHLVSAGGTFRLGFFSPGTSTNRYVGISYSMPDDDRVKLIGSRKVVWVANRDNPISDNSGILMIDEFGNLIISHGVGSLNITVSSTVQPANNATATLLDSGNFILREHNSDGSIIWQSFDYPTDTLLPGMKLGMKSMNMKTNDHIWLLTSWISENVPAKGSFTLTAGFNMDGIGQLIIWWQGCVYWSSGNWQNGRFDFLSQFSNDSYNYFSYFSNDDQKYFIYSSTKNHSLSQYKMDSTGAILDITGLAPFGDCSVDLYPGCVKQKLPDCRKPNDRFEQRKGFMSGEGFNFDKNINLSLFDCRAKCLNNCSCFAYASTYYNQTRCTIWSKEVNFKESNASYSREIYILVPEKAKWKWWIWLVLSMTGVVGLLVFCFFFNFIKRKYREKEVSEAEKEILLCEIGASTTHSSRSGKSKKSKRDRKKGSVLQFFSFESVAAATNNFATTSKLGEGGFGPVYKGKLGDGQEVAIKRLSRNSGQGIVEFKNELVLIAKLQHTNLIKLVGCCIEREEKILIYEYMQNKSLDFFLFDPEKKNLLDWTKRFNIIEGIAQGLLYLHKHSRLKIIHRDLKASNILLDAEMNPKISDFGLARIFGQDETEANTKRVVGTFGYMSPEYAMKGTFSTKSDVFSFGVLLLEIVSGNKIKRFYDPEKALNLIGYAWELWREGKCLDIADPTLGDLYHTNEVLRCIHIGLLCVQESPIDRPSMSDVVSMITNETVPLHPPNQPAFFISKSLPESMAENRSLNNVSISEMEAR